MSDPSKEGPLRLALLSIVEQLRAMTPEQRALAFASIQEKFCIHCGDEQPRTGWCQCTNDD